jgi:hypothetical protein
MEGIAVMRLLNRNERYFITQPNMYARGILFGKMKYELGDHAYVRCPELGLEAEIDFKVKGWMTGTYNAIGGHIKDTKSGKNLFEFSGYWDKEMYIKNLTVSCLHPLALYTQMLTSSRPVRRSSFSTPLTQNLRTPRPVLSKSKETANRKDYGTRSQRPSRLPIKGLPPTRSLPSKTASVQRPQNVESQSGSLSSSVEQELAQVRARETLTARRTSTGSSMLPCEFSQHQHLLVTVY